MLLARYHRAILVTISISFVTYLIYKASQQRVVTLKKIIILLSFLVIGFSLGCSLLDVKDPQKEAEQIYKKDLELIIDGNKYSGTAVLPLKASYSITVIPEEKADRVIIQSCHRDLTIDKPKSGWFSSKYTFTYEPIIGMEDNRNCALEIASLTAKTKNAFAYIDFRDSRPEISLKANIKCNGQYSTSDGVSVCQSAAGLRQSISFEEKTLIEGIDLKCNVMETKDRYTYEWNMVADKCIYYFVSNKKNEAGKRIIHRLNALGFTSSPWKD